MKTLTRHFAPGALLLVGALMPGCSPQQQAQVENTAARTGAEAKRLAARAQQQARPLLTEAGREVRESSYTLKVKTALTTSEKVDATRINVDTENGVLVLKGSVPTPAQKKLAESIARNTAPTSLRIVNRLAVK